MFDKQDEALDVILSHAVLNLNASVVHFFLKEGVPLRQVSPSVSRTITTDSLFLKSAHHLEALDKLKLPRLEAITTHLAEKEAVESDVEMEEMEEQAQKPKKKRGGARARRARERMAADT